MDGEVDEGGGGFQGLTRKKFQMKFGSVGLESERLLIETLADQDERLVDFSIVQQTFHGGWKAVIEVYVRDGAVRCCRHGRETGKGGEIEMDSISVGDGVDLAYSAIFDDLCADWEAQRARWESE